MVDTKVKITLIDGVSNNLRAVQSGFADFAKLGSALAASFMSFERVASGFADIIKSGIEFNKTIETASVGMSGVLMSMTQIENRNLKWNEAMAISKDIIKDLNKQALLTAATPQELTQTFSGLLGIGLGAGMNIDQLKSFTVMGVNAVKSMGLEGRQLIQELRDLLQGSISPQKSTLATALGITGADIKKAKGSAEGLFKYLEARMSGFKISAKFFPETFQGATAVLSGAYQMIIAQAVEKPMARVKELMKAAFLAVLDPEQNGFSKSITDLSNKIGTTLTDTINRVTELGGLFTPMAKAAADLVGSFSVFTSQHLTTMVSGFVMWKSAQMALKPVVYDLLNVYDQISARIGEVKAQLAETLSLEKAKAALAAELSGTGLKAQIAEAKFEASTLYELGMAYAKPKKQSTTKTINDRYDNSIKFSRLFPERKDKEGNVTPWTEEEKAKFKKVKTQLEDEIFEFQQAIKTLGLTDDEALKASTKITEAFPKMGSSAANAKAMMDELTASFTKARAQLDEFTAYGQKVTAFGAELQKLGYQEKQIVEIQRQLLTTYKEGGAAAAGALEKQVLLVGEFSGKLKNLGLQEKELVSIQKQLMAAYKQGGETAVSTLMKEIELTAQATAKANQWSKAIQGVHGWLQKGSGALMGVSMASSIAGEAFENEFFSKVAEWTSKLSLLTMAFEGLWTAIGGKALAVITIAATAMKLLFDYKKAEAAKGIDLNAFDTEGVDAETLAELQKNLKPKFKPVVEEEKKPTLTTKTQTGKTEANLVKLLDDAKKISADIGAKLANRTMSNEEQAFANLNKEIATFQERIDTLKASGQDVTELQEQLNAYSEAATAKLTEQFDTLKVRWDDVITHIKDSQTNFTDIITASYDTMASSFTSFGQNLITEGGSFMDRFDELLKNFANNICNTLLKIYLQGMLTKSIMSWFGFGGGYSTGWLSGSTENASGWLSIGNYVVGHANGGIASGWSLVGEQGPELVNFSNPGRVYTNEETRSMLGGGGVSVKVNVINESGTQMTAQQGATTFDGESYVINVVMNAVATNKGGMRTLLQGARA